MSFFETYDSLYKRLRPDWDHGSADYQTLKPLGKAVAVVAGGIGGIAGVGWSIAKTGGVASREYYEHSFGAARGKGLFDYCANSPIVHTALTAAFVQGAAVALQTANIDINWFVGGNALTGAAGYIGSYVTRAFPKVMSVVGPAFIGRGITRAKRLLEGRWDTDCDRPTIQMPIETQLL